ncbi:preprotein translocase subunit SecG [Sphingomonas sp. AOB5]|uniref:preprotein translocase subunit SecG n=1 Tax=Sphingomonas sp. AOB5 TaxID=3034017 RepID=UPI0023F7FB69|nr:preprotein translocase subunit SecG [Sphingomonas sp. AOB5]MDF7774002.1 preprotein translocase subunit SecG [Sphingomonas sp. AOB5]
MFTFLLVLQFAVAAMLVTVILMQKSEGGGLTTGGSPSGLMSARGAADFLTRATAILATAFIVLCIALAVLAASRRSSSVDATLQKKPAAAAPAQTAPAPGATPATTPLAPATPAAGNSTRPFGQ